RAYRPIPSLADHNPPTALTISNHLQESLEGAEAVVLVVPSQFLRPLARELKERLTGSETIVICSKGIEADSGALMHQVVEEEMPGRPWAVLSGPSFAAEVAGGQPTAVTIAARDRELAAKGAARSEERRGGRQG